MLARIAVETGYDNTAALDIRLVQFPGRDIDLKSSEIIVIQLVSTGM